MLDRRNNALLWLSVAVAGVLALAAMAADRAPVYIEAATVAPPGTIIMQTPQTPNDSGGGDTLVAAPYLYKVFRGWRPDMEPRAWCVTSYATWPRYVFMRHFEATREPGCRNNLPLFVQGPVCPERALTSTPVAFVIVQCGASRFQMYGNKVTGARL